MTVHVAYVKALIVKQPYCLPFHDHKITRSSCIRELYKIIIIFVNGFCNVVLLIFYMKGTEIVVIIDKKVVGYVYVYHYQRRWS